MRRFAAWLLKDQLTQKQDNEMGKKVEAQKIELVSNLVNVRKGIFEEASAIPPEKQDRVCLGVWSVKDLLAHLAGWDYTNLAAARDILAGKLPEFYAHIDRDWKTYNASLVEKYKQDDFSELLTLVSTSHQQLVDYLKTLPAEVFNRDTGVRSSGCKVTIARLLQAETRDEQVHLQQIQEFLDEISHENP